MSRTRYTALERARTLESIERVVNWFKTHDVQLARMTFEALPDGYPTGGSSGRGGGGDHADPTSSAFVARTDGNDDASRAFAKLQEAFVVFGQAHALGRRALPPDDEQKPKPRSPSDPYCTSCARVRDAQGRQAIFVLRTARKGGRKDLCDWCQGEWLGVGKKRSLPDQRLVMAHYAGAFLTDARRRDVLAMSTDDARALYIDGRARSAPEESAG